MFYKNSKVKFKSSISILYLEVEKLSFSVQNNLYVKQILRGGWSGFGMVRSWDGSQLIGMNPNISSFYPKLIPTERCSTILPAKLCNVFFFFKKNLLIDIHDVGHAEADINFCSILARNWWWNQELLVPIIIPGL